MMLASLVLATVVSPTFNPVLQVVRRDQDNYETQAIYEHNENVPDPKDPSKMVSAQVHYFFRFFVHWEPFPDDYEITRTVRTRPESPAKKFQMTRERIGLNDDVDSRQSANILFDTAIKEGIPPSVGPTLFSALTELKKRTIEDIDPTPITIDPNNGIKPGGWTIRDYGYNLYYTDLHIQLYKAVKAAGQKEWTETKVGQERFYDLWEYRIPIPMFDEKFIPDRNTDTNTMHIGYTLPDGFGGVQFSDEHASLLGLGGTTLPRLSLSYDITGKGLVTSAATYRKEVLNTLPKRLNDFVNITGLGANKVDGLLNSVAAQGNSMNSLQVPGDPGSLGVPNCGSRLFMPPGTIWVPDKPGYQVMTSTTPIDVMFALSADVNGGLPMFESGRMHCLNKDLHEPAPGVRYFPYMSNDDVITQLAEIASKSRFRGPWDQVRTWIYTDQVGFDDANARIFPPVSAGQYTNDLFDVFKLGGLDPKSFKSDKIFDPKLLTAATATDAAMKWFSMQIGEQFGKEVRKWMEKMPKELSSMLAAPADDFEKKHLPRLLTSLLGSLDEDTRMGALAFLDKSKGGEGVLKDQVGDFRDSLYSSDKKEVALAKKVAARYLSELPPDVQWLMQQ